MTRAKDLIIKPVLEEIAHLVNLSYDDLDGILFSPMRRIVNLYYRNFDSIFLLHIHKCGGTSIDYAIKRQFPFSNYTIASAPSFRAAKSFYQLDSFADESYWVPKYRELLLLYLMEQQKVKYISGHVPFSEIAYREFGSKYKFITILRDPVERWFSVYLYNRFIHRDYGRIDEDLTTFLGSEKAEYLGHQYVVYLGGLDLDKEEDYTSQRAIDRAKENLHKFEIIGFLEHLEDFVRKFEDRFVFKLKVPHKKKNPISESYRESVTREVEEKVRAICKPDLEIYQYAIDNFGPFLSGGS